MKPVTDYPPGSVLCVYAPGSVYVGHFIMVSPKKMLDIDTGKLTSVMRTCPVTKEKSVHFTSWGGYLGTIKEALNAQGQLKVFQKALKTILPEES